MVMYDRIDDTGNSEDTTNDRTDLNQEVEDVAGGLSVFHRYGRQVVSKKVMLIKESGVGNLKKIAGIMCVLISLLLAVNWWT